MNSKKNGKKNSKKSVKINSKKNVIKVNKTRKINQKGGCDLPFFPDGDDVWERLNGTKTGKFYSLLQRYNLIKWRDCHEMYRFAKELKKYIEATSQNNRIKLLPKLKELETQIEAQIGSILDGYILYDLTEQLKSNIEKLGMKREYSSPSFVIGGTDINLADGKITLTQATSDIFKKPLTYTFSFYKAVNIIKKTSTINEKEVSEIFFFTDKDAEFTFGFKGKGYTLPTTYINKKVLYAEEGRKLMLKNRVLASHQKLEQEIQSGNPTVARLINNINK